MHSYECEKCFEIVNLDSVPDTGGCQKGNAHIWRDLGEVGTSLYECGQCNETVESATIPALGTCRRGGSHTWCGPILEVQITPTEETERADLDEDDFDDDQLSDMVGVSRGTHTGHKIVFPNRDFEIPPGTVGAIDEDVEFTYPKGYLDEADPDNGNLQPGLYHWDGKGVTFVRQLDENSGGDGEDMEMDDEDADNSGKSGDESATPYTGHFGCNYYLRDIKGQLAEYQSNPDGDDLGPMLFRDEEDATRYLACVKNMEAYSVCCNPIADGEGSPIKEEWKTTWIVQFQGEQPVYLTSLEYHRNDPNYL